MFFRKAFIITAIFLSSVSNTFAATKEDIKQIARVASRFELSVPGAEALKEMVETYKHTHGFPRDHQVSEDILSDFAKQIYEGDSEFGGKKMRADHWKHNKKYKGKYKGKIKGIGKGLGVLGAVLSLFYLADDANAHGTCYAIKHNTPVISVWYEGLDEIQANYERKLREDGNTMNQSIYEAEMEAVRYTNGLVIYEVDQLKCKNLDGDKITEAAHTYFERVKTIIYLDIEYNRSNFKRGSPRGDKINLATFDFQKAVKAACLDDPCCVSHCCDCNECKEEKPCTECSGGECEMCAGCPNGSCTNGCSQCTSCDSKCQTPE